MIICVDNHKSSETITYGLPIFIGHVGPPLSSSFIAVWVDGVDKKILWPVTNGKFRALVRLKEGSNTVQFRCKEATCELSLTFEKLSSSKIVRPVIIKCCDDDGRIQAPAWEDSSVESAQKRVALGAQLLQTFNAEKLHDDGLGRHTFHIDTDSSGQPRCQIFTSCLKLEDAVKKDGGELWCQFAKELMDSDEFEDKKNCKFLAFMSFTRYNYTGDLEELPQNWSDSLKYTVGHTALGGGGLALFGSGNLHTWAEKLEDVTKRFTDTRKIDRTKFLDDSAYRQFHWANYATGLGASLHELGHTFDLAHTPSGIMARGFDDMNKFFTVWESPKVERKRPAVIHMSPEKSESKPQPILIQVEPFFMKTRRRSQETMVMRNYDGTVTRVVHGSDGSQVISNDTSHPTVNKASKDVGHPEINASRPQQLALSTVSPRKETPVSLTPKSPPGASSPVKMSPILETNNLRSNEGDAKWYRSSSVLLRYHKWMNGPKENDPGQPPAYVNGEAHSSAGLRIVEVRHTSSGDVAHHWEFLETEPPQTFNLTKSMLQKVLSKGATEFTVVIEDDCGNFVRKDNVQLSSVGD